MIYSKKAICVAVACCCLSGTTFARNKSLAMSNVTVNQAIDALKKQNASYEIKENNTIVRSTDQISAVSQKKTITGTIVDPSGMPVIGANVMVKGTTNGTITDMDGKFLLEVSENAILQISYIGYLPQEIKVSNQKHLAISLKEDSQNLDEVVVVDMEHNGKEI